MTQGLIGGVYASLARAQIKPASEGLTERGRAKLYVAVNFVRSYYWSRRYTGLFQDVQTYCLFMGHARSGGSLVGGLLDAHPNALIADEVDIFPYVAAGFSREQVFHILLRRSQLQAERGRSKSGREKQAYSYQVPGQWQGKYETLRVIGNRKAGISTQQVRRDPGLFDRLRHLLGNSVILKTIVTIRNPFDTISTMSLRSGRDLQKGIVTYFANCETIEQQQQHTPPQDVLILRHEDLLANPETKIDRICRFLGIPDYPDYLQACVGILYASPVKSRAKVHWSPELIRTVMAGIEQYPFLNGYSFDT
ncbi:MAG TPA: sulfotransferase [Anaerolineaceae bacterium]|nr:sulfotransferase [Anaerolineaceae bacterium]